MHIVEDNMNHRSGNKPHRKFQALACLLKIAGGCVMWLPQHERTRAASNQPDPDLLVTHNPNDS